MSAPQAQGFPQPAPAGPQGSIYPSYAPSTVTQPPQATFGNVPVPKEAENQFPSSGVPTSLGNGTLNYGQSALSGAGFIGVLSGTEADKNANDLSLKFGSFGMSSPAQGAGGDGSQESAQMPMGVAQPSGMPHMNYMPGAGMAGAGMAAGQYPGFQYGGAFGGASTGSIPGATGVQGAYGGGMEGAYGGGEYAAAGMPEPAKSADSSNSSSRNYNGNGRRGFKADSKGEKNNGSQQQQQQQQQQPQQPHPQQMPPQQAMQAGMPYGYQQLGYPQYPIQYHQAAFYGGYQGYPQAAAMQGQYAQQQQQPQQPQQQPTKMRPGMQNMQQYTFPAQGGYTAASYMAAAPATMGYDYSGYAADGSGYPVQPEAAPATSGAAATGTADAKAAAPTTNQQDIQQLAAAGFQHQYAAQGAYPQANYAYGGYAAQMQPQTGASMQQPAYGQQPYGGWQGGSSQQGSGGR